MSKPTTVGDFAQMMESLKRIAYRITLPMPSPMLSPNARAHWAAKAKAVKNARQTAMLTMLQALRANGAIPPKWESCHYSVTFFCKTSARRDEDNLMASLKSYRDGIADAELVANDSGMRAQGCAITKDKAPRVEITLWENRKDN